MKKLITGLLLIGSTVAMAATPPAPQPPVVSYGYVITQDGKAQIVTTNVVTMPSGASRTTVMKDAPQTKAQLTQEQTMLDAQSTDADAKSAAVAAAIADSNVTK